MWTWINKLLSEFAWSDTVPGPNNEVDLTKFFQKMSKFWYNEANNEEINEENNEVILGQFSGF